jgi:hypothetical protein
MPYAENPAYGIWHMSLEHPLIFIGPGYSVHDVESILQNDKLPNDRYQSMAASFWFLQLLPALAGPTDFDRSHWREGTNCGLGRAINVNAETRYGRHQSQYIRASYAVPYAA